MPLPPGFVLDQQPRQQGSVSVPQGFVLDQAPQPAAQEPVSNAFVDYTKPLEAGGSEPSSSNGLLHNPVGDALFNNESGVVPETARVVATGGRDLVNAGLSLAELVAGLSARGAGFEPGKLPRIPEWDQIGNGFEALEPKTAVGQFITPMGQYVGGRSAVDRVAGRATSTLGDVGRSAATDFAAFSPEDQRISDMIVKEAENPTGGFWNTIARGVAYTNIPQWLARGENTGETPEGNLTSRLQNVGEGQIIEAATRLALSGTKVVGGALLSPFFKGVGNAAERERQIAEQWAAKAQKPVEDLTIQDVAELARRGDIEASRVLEHPEVQQRMSEQVRSFMDAGTINPNSPEFISQLDELTRRVTANSAARGQQAVPQADMDAVVRTLWGEARGEGDEGIQAAANVILNRGEKEGRSLAEIVRAPKQFSAWNDARTRPGMDALRADDPEYQRIAAIVDKVARGELPDNTGGATHYISFAGQKANGDAVPNWAKVKPTATVGNHTFFSPDGAPVQRNGNTISVTPDGTAIRGGVDQGTAAGMERASAVTSDIDARMAEAAKNDPLIAEIMNAQGLTPEAKRAAFQRFEGRSAQGSEQPILASRNGAQVRADVSDPGTAAGIERQRAAEADRLAEMMARAETDPAVRAVVDSGIDDAAKLRVYDSMVQRGAARPLTQGPREAAPFRGFDESVPRADQDAIVANAQRLEAEAKAVEQPQGVKPDDQRAAEFDKGNAATTRAGAADQRMEPPAGAAGKATQEAGAGKGRGADGVQETRVANEQPVRQGSERVAAEQPAGKRESSSWVIRNKQTGEVIAETFDKNKVDALNTEKYEAVPILEHLQGLNKNASSGAVSEQALTKAPGDGKKALSESRSRLREAAANKKAPAETLDSWSSKEGMPESGARLAKSSNQSLKSVGEGIADVAPEIAALRRDAQGGAAPEKSDIFDALETAASAVENARAEGLSPSKGLDLVKGDAAAEAVYRLLHNKNMTKLASREEIANRLGRYVDEATRAGDDASAEEILSKIASTADDARGQGHLFDQFDDGAPNRQAIKEPKTEVELNDNIEALGGKHEQKLCGI